MPTPQSQPPKRGAFPNGPHIRALREKKLWDQETLAKKAGLSKRTLQTVEAGKRRVDLDTLAAIADKLGVKAVEDLISPDPAPNPPSALLAPNRPPDDFKGRADEIARIVASLRAETPVAICAVKAQGGMGKTTLAEKVAELVADRFPVALKLSLNGTADEPTRPAQSMTEVVRHFRPDLGQLSDTPDELRPLYLSLLTQHRPLVILDNAGTASQVTELIRDRPPGVGFVVTSRRQVLATGVTTIRLDGLHPAESLALLRELAGRGTDAELTRVAELCAHLPLALRVAGTFLREKPTWTPARYISALETERLATLNRVKVEDRDVEAVLALSVRQLIHDHPERAERFQTLSVFPADFDTKAASAVWQLDEDTAFDELDGLLTVSLVQEADDARWELHDLMRPIARRAFEYAEDGHPLKGSGADRVAAAERRFAEHYERVQRRASDLYLRGHEDVLRGLELFDREVVNIRHGFRWSSQAATADASLWPLCGSYPEAGVFILDLRIPLRELIDWLTTQLETQGQRI